MCYIRSLTVTQLRSADSCMSSLKQNIDGHNKSVLHKKIVPPKTCNCRKPAECPVDGNCLKESIVYQATVTNEDNNPLQTYVGLTENSFKTRYSNHKMSFSHSIRRFIIELSKHIWHLKDNESKFKVIWRSLKLVAHTTPVQIDVTFASGRSTLLFVNPS